MGARDGALTGSRRARKDRRRPAIERRPDVASAGGLLAGIVELRSGQLVEPPVQATLLRMLAAREGLRLTVGAEDFAGREGVAVSATEPGVDGSPTTEVTLILDPRTGAVLGHERTLVEGGTVPGPRPLPMGSAAWVESGRVDALGERP